MSMAASPRKPWESALSPTAANAAQPLPATAVTAVNTGATASSAPFASSYDPTGGAAPGAPSTAHDAHALVATNNRPSALQPSSALTPATAQLPFDPSAQPILPSLNPMGMLPSALYQPGMLPMGGMYPGAPMPVVGFNPLTHIGSSIQSFGRFSQLLQLNFDALHMSFSSLLRLFDSYSILRAETVMLGQTFTTLNVFAWLGSRVWRLLERLRGRGGALDMEKGWKEAAGASGMPAGAVPSGGKPGQPSFFSGWTWALLVIAIGWSVVRWLVRIVRRRILGHVDPPPQLPQPAMLPPGAAPQPNQPLQPNGQPADPNQPTVPSAGLPAGMAGVASPYGMGGVGGMASSYNSPYSSLGYSGMSSSYGGYGGSQYGGYGGYGSGYGSSYLGSGMGTGYGTAGYGYGGMSGYGGGMAGMSGMSGMSGYGTGGYGMGGLGY